jgi:hypothetical protein
MRTNIRLSKPKLEKYFTNLRKITKYKQEICKLHSQNKNIDMKKTIFIIFACISISSLAQPTKVVSALNYLRNGQLEKAKINIDEATVNDQTRLQAKTWYYRGNIYLSIYLTKEVKYKILETNALQVSYDALQKALELDPQVSNENLYPPTPKIGLLIIAEQYYNKGIDLYNDKNYLQAIGNFELSKNINAQFGNSTSKEDLNISYCKAHLKRDNPQSIADNEIKHLNINDKCRFRKVHFGITIDSCKDIETASFGEESELKGLKLVTYSTSVFDLNAILVYIFAKDTLTRAKYSFTDSYVSQNNYIKDYLAIKEKLTEKYGKPLKDEKIWIDDLYKDNPNDYGMAVSAGHLVYYAKYDLDCMNITVLLKGENFKISISVEYSSNKYNSLEDKVKKDAEKDDY